MKKRFLSCILISLSYLCTAQNLDLHNMLSAPFLSNLVISAKTDRLAWVENTKGVRNIYIATKPDYIPLKITQFTQDDGLEIAGLTWSDDEKNLFFVRGNPPQVRGTQPHNPSHVLEGGATVLWKWNIVSKTLEKIGNGGTPSVSGDKMVFTKAGQIYIKNINDTLQAKQLCQVRNGAGQLRWSPDGRKLAFVSSRGAHSFVGVYDFDTNDYTFINPSVDTDTEPCWSPDSKQIAFLRIKRNPEPDIIFFPQKDNEPWSIVVADVAVQRIGVPLTAKTIFTAEKGKGSIYWNHTGKQQLQWTATNKIIFAWEKTGWQQLYMVAPEGGRVVALTNGNFEVDEVLLSADNKHVIYTSNEGNIDTKDVFTVNTEGGKPKLLVEDLKNQYYGVEFNICPAADNETVYFLRSEALAPARVYSAKNGILGKPLMLMDRSFPMEQLTVPEALTLKAKDGFSFQSQVFYPKNMDKTKKYPAVIFVHGGSRRQMYLAYHSGWYYANAYHLSQYFASKGYIAMSINYRSGIGYGRDFREAENYGASGCSEFQDLEAAGEWLKAHPSVSASKIGVWGGSYGGYMTAHGLARRSDLFAAGADIHGVHNWNTAIQTFNPDYDSLRYPKHGQLAYKSSPVYYLDGWKSPVFIAHADDDQNVNFLETEYLVRALRRKGVEHELLVVPDDVHGFLRYESWYRIYAGVVDFFDRKLKK
jgi:dipeptidyl aminopeptidase/acylaminoacyl peptidase